VGPQVAAPHPIARPATSGTFGTGIATPASEKIAAPCARTSTGDVCEVVARGDLRHVGEARDHGRHQSVCCGAVPELPHVVQHPTIDSFVRAYRAGVVRANCDACCGQRRAFGGTVCIGTVAPRIRDDLARRVPGGRSVVVDSGPTRVGGSSGESTQILDAGCGRAHDAGAPGDPCPASRHGES
jgi:hypothetical protein